VEDLPFIYKYENLHDKPKAMNVLITLNPGLGSNIGPNCLITCDTGTLSTVTTITQLLNGLTLTIPDETTFVYIDSIGVCTNRLTLTVPNLLITTLSPTGVPSTLTPTLSPTTILSTSLTPTTVTIGYVPPIVDTYGYLYNSFVYLNGNQISSEDNWRIPDKDDFDTLGVFVGGTLTANGPNAGAAVLDCSDHLEVASNWISLGTPALNSVGFNAKSSGVRHSYASNFSQLGYYASYKTLTPIPGLEQYLYDFTLRNDVNYALYNAFNSKVYGLSIRLIRTVGSGLSNGQTGTYTGNDGKVHGTICIGTQEWLSENLKETQYRTHSLIPIVQDMTWYALSTGARCYYTI